MAGGEGAAVRLSDGVWVLPDPDGPFLGILGGDIDHGWRSHVEQLPEVDRPAVHRAGGHAPAGTATAVSLSQYWNACTKVMDRIPPEVTLMSTTGAMITAPSQVGAPMVAARVTPAPWNWGSR